MKIIPLGAGQEIGRSCILIQIKDKLIMMDCGININYNDHRRFPDFSAVPLIGNLSCVLVSHFHLDHCGALVRVSNMFKVPVVATPPTKEIMPLMLEDLGDDNRDDIRACASAVVGVGLGEHHTIDGIEIVPLYAGHVLGACMFYVRYSGESCLYTGDFNSSADNHLLSGRVPCLEPGALITEATYGFLIRESRRKYEIEFLEAILRCVEAGGKVLIPIFAVGRAQEIFALIENFWERNGIDVPLFSTSLMTDVANKIYRKYTSFLRDPGEGSSFEFVKIKVLDKNKINEIDKNKENEANKGNEINRGNEIHINSEKNKGNDTNDGNDIEKLTCIKQDAYNEFSGNQNNEKSQSNKQLSDNIYGYEKNASERIYNNLFGGYEGPMVVFASPGMLQTGLSLYLFKKWHNDPKNLIIFTGYCSKGTIGHKLLKKESVCLGGITYEPKLTVKSFPFSAHSDFIGIQKIITQSAAKNIVLVHGDKNKMKILKQKLKKTGLNVSVPANGKVVHIPEKRE